jgi:hypothetical protein
VKGAVLEAILTEHFWLAAVLWALTYFSDYAVTLHTARLYQVRAHEHFTFGGSFELTPYYQADVDRLRRWSPRFWLALALSTVLMGLAWVLSVVVLGMPALFTFLAGALLLRQAAVHLRHARNYVLFRAVRDTGEVSGQISYARPLVLRLSAAEFAAWGLLFLALGVVTSSWFLFGGALSCAVTGYQHARLARAARHQASSARL